MNWISVEDRKFLAFVVNKAIENQRLLIRDLEKSFVWMAKEETIKEELSYLERLKIIRDRLIDNAKAPESEDE